MRREIHSFINMEVNALNVVMIGASRSGKTSILASMLEQVTCSVLGDYFYIEDKSEYCYKVSDKRASEVSLSENVDAMKDLLNPQLNEGKIQPRLAELTGTTAPFTYDITVQSKTDKWKVEKEVLHVKFTDVKGESFAKRGREFDEIEKIIKQSQVLLVAVDVPALMYAKEKKKSGLNRYMNLPYELITATNMLAQDYNDPDLKRMVAFIPIKCEYWMHHNKMEEVYSQIEEVYKTPLVSLANGKNVRVMIMPMETIGGLEFSHYSDDDNSFLMIYGESRENRSNSDKFIEEDYIGGNGIVRCEKVSENKVRIKNGAIYTLHPSDKLILAKERGKYPYVYNEGDKAIAIPFFWFIPTGKGYTPKYCDQALFQVLKFAIECVEKQRENESQENLTIIDENPNLFKTIWNLVKEGVKLLWKNLLQRFGFQSEEQYLKFSSNIKCMMNEGLISEEHIRFLINKENGVDLLDVKI